MNRRTAGKALAGAIAAASAACTPRFSPRRVQQSLLIGGASAMLPLVLAQAQAFMRGRSGLSVVVERGGSLPALIAASRGAIDVAAMTRALSDSEDSAGARQYLLARGAVGVVIHHALSVEGLSSGQVRGLLTGGIGNWQAIGGPDLPVIVLVRAPGASERFSAEQVVLGGGDFSADVRECATDDALRQEVARTPGAIACLHAGMHGGAGGGAQARGPADKLAPIAVDGVAMSDATVLTGRYPFTYSFHLLVHGVAQGARDDFVRFARSHAGQAIVAGHGLVPAC